MAGSPILAFVSLILLAAAVLFQYFVILSGTVYSNPEPNFYFLAADTSGIGQAPATTVWTFFQQCALGGAPASSVKYVTGSCFGLQAAPPFSPVTNFNTTTNVPEPFVNDEGYYYRTSKAMFAMYIIALFFGTISLLTGLLALCTRLGSYLSAVTSFIALTFQGIAAALMTAWTVSARNAFRNANRAAELGAYGYGFTWGSVVAFFLSVVLFCVAGAVGKEKSAVSKKSRFGMFGRKRSTRSRGSFGGENKDEFS